MNEDFEPEIVVLYCGRSGTYENHLSEGTKQGSGFRTRLIMMPCSSKIETLHLVKLIEEGNDGVVLVGCPEERCQFLVGSNRAAKRLGHARTLLDEAGMSSNRLRMVRRENLSADDIMSLAEEEANAVRSLGQNPMKTDNTYT
ncbi:hydrogenase iron-sulfur subunit [Chloroflexota bacterium]